MMSARFETGTRWLFVHGCRAAGYLERFDPTPAWMGPRQRGQLCDDPRFRRWSDRWQVSEQTTTADEEHDRRRFYREAQLP